VFVEETIVETIYTTVDEHGNVLDERREEQVLKQ